MTTALDTIGQRSAAATADRIGQATAVEQARAVAEVQAAVVVAQNVPRDMDRVQRDVQAACGSIALARKAFYAVKNRGEGPSVHLARSLARIYGNFQYGVHELRRDDAAGESEVQAFAWDVQTNTRSTRTFIHPHARMKGGKREALTDLTDIYLSNQNVGARAVRECIFAALPEELVEWAEELCRETLKKGDGRPVAARAADAVTAFAGLGVTEQQLADRIGRKRGEWTAQDIASLEVVFRSIRAGDATADEQFPPRRVTGAEVTGSAPAAPPGSAGEAARKALEDHADEIAAGPKATPAQVQKLVLLLNDHGVESDEAQREALSERVGRTLASRKDLTKAEAHQIIDALEQLGAPPAPDGGGNQ